MNLILRLSQFEAASRELASVNHCYFALKISNHRDLGIFTQFYPLCLESKLNEMKTSGFNDEASHRRTGTFGPWGAKTLLPEKSGMR